MQTITLQAHTGADGVLKLEVPVGLADVAFDVVVVCSPRDGTSVAVAPQNLAQLIGAIDDPTFVRHPQGEYEQRESLE
jgi:hypothetical protein